MSELLTPSLAERQAWAEETRRELAALDLQLFTAAAMLKLSPTTLSNLLNGRTFPSAELRERLDASLARLAGRSA